MISIGSISINGAKNKYVKGFEQNGFDIVFVLHSGDRVNYKCQSNFELNYIVNNLDKAYEAIKGNKDD